VAGRKERGLTAGRAEPERGEPSQRVGFLALLDPGDRADLVALGRFRRYRRGDGVMRQGEAADSVVVVLDGQVKIVVDTPDGRSIVHAVYGPEDVVGEFEAIGDYATRAANVVAIDAVTARVLSRREYVDYLLAHPAASLALVRILIRRLGAADRRRMAGTSAEATYALAQYLVELADGALTVTPARTPESPRLNIPLAQNDLASLIGVSRNSLVRAFSSLRSRGLIATEGRSVTVPDPEALRRYAEEHASEEGKG
jgi:CRP/FNR family transcriptional regulator, cyclic AMP receptor protein